MMTCPKCGFEQGKSRECIACGIIFDKIRPDILLPSAVVNKRRFRIHEIYNDALNAIGNYGSALKDRVRRKVGIDRIRGIQSVMRVAGLWLRDVLDRILTILVCGAVAWAFGIFLLSTLEGLWHLYLETEVGKHYLQYYPFRVQMIYRIIHYSPVYFSLSVCLTVLKACLLVAAVARVSFFARGYYEHRPAVFKIAVWSPVCAAAAGWLLQEEFDVTFQFGLALAVVPTLFLFIPCFELAVKCLPEANLIQLFRLGVNMIKNIWSKAVSYIIEDQRNGRR